ncbi:hypothetical protein HHI36_020203 [Cryptolaemus montrouzieri]|uniref:Reverse transcriptase domain-containing protein n=1 Tax=Cryptolaemus montrouzieri TaxID=559131 RepID=A0ABD2NA91_9CUCU
MYNQTVSYFDSMNLFTSNQFGFRKGKSTCDAVMGFVSTAVECLELGLHSLTLFLDLSKAFDCVFHDKLLWKLRAYGFKDTNVGFICSFLSGRQQVVFDSGVFSGKKAIEIGGTNNVSYFHKRLP